MSEICEWLEHRGLGELAAVLVREQVDFEILSELTEADLKDIGLPLGPRKKLLKAIREWQGSGSAVDPSGLSASGSISPPPSAGEAERRQLTVMFCDLVGSTALSEALDPEAYRRTLAAYQSAAKRAIERYDGYIARYMGDGLLVYFGYPHAHEDDAERAVLAGLDIIDAVRGLTGLHLCVRLGAATGLVVAGDIIGEDASEERAVLGETPNLAARLQSSAEPDTLLISETTHRLVGHLFEVESMPPLSLKGISKPVNAVRVERRTVVQTRSDALRSSRLSPLVGRQGELALVLERWKQACQGAGQAVLVCAEPGVGKSRLVHEVRQRTAGAACLYFAIYCSPHHVGSAFHPVSEAIGRAAGFAHGDSGAERLSKLEAWLTALDLDSEPRVPILGPLVGADIRGRYASDDAKPEELRRRILEILVGIVRQLARDGAVLLVAEDVQWGDASTLELLGLLLGQLHEVPLLALLTYRPEFEVPWASRASTTTLAMNHLTGQECRALAEHVLVEQRIEGDSLDAIVARSDGVPLFVEELSRSAIEALDERTGRRRIPATLRDALMARLDRLGFAKSIAQQASIIGRKFSYELLRSVCGGPTKFDEALAALESGDLISRHGGRPDETYRFKHALVQETSYDSLLTDDRRAGHLRVARGLEREGRLGHPSPPEVLAIHFALAGEHDEAVTYRQFAGELSLKRNALVEAETHFMAGLELLDNSPEVDEDGTTRVRLTLALGAAQMSLHGFGSNQAHRTYEAARQLVAERRDLPDRFDATWGLWMNRQAVNSAEFAHKLRMELDSLVNETTDSGLLLQAHHAAWTELYQTGDIEASNVRAAEGQALYSVEAHGDHTYRYGGHDPGVCAASHGALNMWMLGFPEKAIERLEAAEELAATLEHRGSAGMAKVLGATLHQFLEAPQAVVEMCAEPNQAPAQWQHAMHALRGWALVRLESTEDGLRECADGVRGYRQTGAKVRLPYLEYLLADAYRVAGRPVEALTTIVAAIQHMGERATEPELLRLKGDLLLQQATPEPAAAEQIFLESLRISRERGTQSWELRTARALARLLGRQGRVQEARERLAPVLAWFPEALDTPDLKAARALLHKLS